MVKRAYLVTGPESSGTRLMTRALIAAGCFGDAGHEQRLDGGIPDGTSPIVWRRSVPHKQRYPDLTRLVERLRTHEYVVQAVVTTRDWHAMLRSQVALGHTPDIGKARHRTRRAYLHIFKHLDALGVPYIVASYESLVQRPRRALAAIAGELGLPAPVVDVYDGNEKWFERVKA